MEFLLRASPTIVYKFFTSPDCLIRWFCDEVDITEDFYTFTWEGSDEVAELVDDIEDEFLRFHWENAESDDEHLEIRLSKSEVTAQTILEITEYCDEDELEDQQRLWESQIKTLMLETGG